MEDVILATLKQGDALYWRALGNSELRQGVVVSNYPEQHKLWAVYDLPDAPGVIMPVEYKQVAACGSSGLTTKYKGD